MILSLRGSNEHPRSYLLFLKFSSMKRPSNELVTVIPLIHLERMFSFTYKRIPPPFTVWLRRQGFENPSMINCNSEAVSRGVKHLLQSLFLNQVAGLSLVSFLASSFSYRTPPVAASGDSGNVFYQF